MSSGVILSGTGSALLHPERRRSATSPPSLLAGLAEADGGLEHERDLVALGADAVQAVGDLRGLGRASAGACVPISWTIRLTSSLARLFHRVPALPENYEERFVLSSVSSDTRSGACSCVLSSVLRMRGTAATTRRRPPPACRASRVYGPGRTCPTRRAIGEPGPVPVHPRPARRPAIAAASGPCGSTRASARAAESNRRYRYLLEHGTTGLSVAFDLPTQIGYDSDDPHALGRGGPRGRGDRQPRGHGARCSTASRSSASRPR